MPLSLLQAVNDPNAWNQTIAVATIVIAVATVFYLIATVLLWLTTRRSVNLTRDMFEASHRPYVGASKISYKIDDENQMLEFVILIINSGASPATDLNQTQQILLDGIPLHMDSHESTGQCLMPKETSSHHILLTGEKFVKAINSGVLTLRYSLRYKGVGQKQHQYDDESAYYHNKGLLIHTHTKTN